MPFADPDDINASIIRLTREATTLRHTLHEPATQQRLRLLLEQAEHQIATLHRIIPLAQRGLQQLADASGPVHFAAAPTLPPTTRPQPIPLPTRTPTRARAALPATTTPAAAPAPALPRARARGVGETWTFLQPATALAMATLLERLLAGGHLAPTTHAAAYELLASREGLDLLQQGGTLYVNVPTPLATDIRAAITALPPADRERASTLIDTLMAATV